MDAVNSNFKMPKPPKPRQTIATSAAENQAGYSAGARSDQTVGQGAGWEHGSNVTNRNDADFDDDLYRASILQRYLRGEGGLQNSVKSYAGDLNTDVARSAMNKFLAQAGQRKGLKGQLAGLGAQQTQEEMLLKNEAREATGAGIKNTRQNFNQRGLLYGGMREGGEQNVKAQGAATLASGLAGVKRDYANQADATKAAIANIGLKTQQEAMQRANLVMETNMRNNVARQQAYQQLGEGVGYAAGAAYGSMNKTAPAQANYNNSAVTGGSYRDFGSVA